ncbi:MAG: cation:proton antiporter [Candidatus Obscuribacter sp.]|jgi:NhaP-type Na+/H+ or K+/H+ antiporter|nr:cation:proton antiporter [Candidatus Obscuribacter sp.]MBP7577853.1 cation:proton antiporter [Candidatus Obscuribacter sp.]
MESAIAIISIGLIVFLSHLFAVTFEKTRIPDVLPLVILGLLLGPVFHLASPKDFGQVGQVFTTIALVIILFNCGLELNLGLLLKSFLPALRLGTVTFWVTVGTTVWFASQVLGLTVVEGCILGCIAAACSPPVVIPMLAKLNATAETRTMLILESTICEVLGIVSTLAFIKVAQQSTVQPTAMVGHIIASFIMAAMIGFAAGIAWSSLLKIVRHVEDNIFCTPAFVCIVFGTAELFDYSGPVAALVFGLVLGNIKEMSFLRKFPQIKAEAVSLTHMEKTFFAALVFLLKSLFFVYVGLSMQFNSAFLAGTALLLTLWTLIVRLVVVKVTTGPNISTYDRSLVSIMIPKGLAAAVLASLVLQSGVEGAGTIREVAFGIILFSICVVATLTFCLEKGWLNAFFGYVFGQVQHPVTAANDASNMSSVELLQKATGQQAPVDPLAQTLDIRPDETKSS